MIVRVSAVSVLVNFDWCRLDHRITGFPQARATTDRQAKRHRIVLKIRNEKFTSAFFLRKSLPNDQNLTFISVKFFKNQHRDSLARHDIKL